MFNPYAGVKTSILFLDKSLAKKTDKILFVKVENDGFDLGAQRRPIEKNDLPDALNILRTWRDHVIARSGAAATKQSVSDEEIASGFAFATTSKALLVSISKLAETGDYNLSADRYREVTLSHHKRYPMAALGDVAELIRGITFNKKDQLDYETPDSLRVATTKAAQEEGIVEADLYYVPRSMVKSDEKLLREGDILISTANSLNLLGRTTYVPKLDYKSSFGAFMTLIRANKDVINPIYLLHCLRTDFAKSYFLSTANTTTNISNLTFADLNSFQIPLPPLETQRQLVDEIAAHQRIIDGARQVVEGWKPNLELELAESLHEGVDEWEKFILGDIAELEYGFTASAEETGDARFIRITDINEDGTLNKDTAKYVSVTDENKAYLLQEGDLLVARTGATYGKTLYFEGDEQSLFASYLIRIRFSKDVILPKYYWYFARSDDYWTQAKSLMTGGGQPQFNGNALKQISLYAPPLEIQREIVARIECERAIVEGNRELIPLYEEKVKTVIERVWES